MATPELGNSGVPQSAAEELAAIYARAAKQLEQWVLHPPGGTENGRLFRQARAAELLHKIDALMHQLNGQSAAWVGQNLPQVYSDGIKRAQVQAVEAGLSPKDVPIKASFSFPDRRTIELFSKEILGDLGKASGAMGEQAKTVLRKTG